MKHELHCDALELRLWKPGGKYNNKCVGSLFSGWYWGVILHCKK